MTLLETVIALVILSLSALGVLELFQGANRSASDAEAWTAAVAYAEEGMEAAKIGAAATHELASRGLPPGYSRSIESSPAPHGMMDISVAVAIPGGARFALHRLMPAQ